MWKVFLFLFFNNNNIKVLLIHFTLLQFVKYEHVLPVRYPWRTKGLRGLVITVLEPFTSSSLIQIQPTWSSDGKSLWFESWFVACVKWTGYFTQFLKGSWKALSTYINSAEDAELLTGSGQHLWRHIWVWFLWRWQKPRLTNKIPLLIHFQANFLRRLTAYSNIMYPIQQSRAEVAAQGGNSAWHCCSLCFTNAGHKESIIFYFCCLAPFH